MLCSVTAQDSVAGEVFRHPSLLRDSLLMCTPACSCDVRQGGQDEEELQELDAVAQGLGEKES